MTDGHRPKLDEKSARVLSWLYEHSGDFEGAGVEEASLAGATGLSESEVTDAVDHLESREAVARIPQHGAGFLLQPARGWADVCEELGTSSASG